MYLLCKCEINSGAVKGEGGGGGGGGGVRGTALRNLRIYWTLFWNMVLQIKIELMSPIESYC